MIPGASPSIELDHSLSPALLHLNNLASAVDGRSESAARAGVANASHESDLAVEKDENER
jgi:hypothetical protein